jgi:hypothetical protein
VEAPQAWHDKSAKWRRSISAFGRGRWFASDEKRAAVVLPGKRRFNPLVVAVWRKGDSDLPVALPADPFDVRHRTTWDGVVD